MTSASRLIRVFVAVLVGLLLLAVAGAVLWAAGSDEQSTPAPDGARAPVRAAAAR
ncbi:hypothetical protein [Kitasatospora sp. NPDC088346]|uniref:hypothetical protein n=1 Tax=Kitasatospora sp. NPDC088346 TaxID=3364073 RepID=UPI0037FAF1FF